MSSVRICTNCKWEYPLHYKYSKCRWCNAFLDKHICWMCNKLKPLSEYYFHKSGKNAGTIKRICKDCNRFRSTKESEDYHKYYDRHLRFIQRKKEYLKKLYQDWLQITNVPFKPLTEKEWLEACAYFNGCAICGNPDIEVRQFFVKFEKGGRYTPWNVFPVCGNCNKYNRYVENPFVWLEYVSKRFNMSKERKEMLINFFIMQLKKYIERGNSNEQSTN